MTTAACAGWTSRPSAWCVRTVVSTSLRHLPSIHRVDIARVTSRRELRSVFGRRLGLFISQRKVPPTNQQLRTARLHSCAGQIIIYLGLDVDAVAPAVNVHTQTPRVSLSLTSDIRARHAVRSCTRALGPRGTPADPSPWTCSPRTWAIAGECSAGQPP